jgi:hypothetical protein
MKLNRDMVEIVLSITAIIISVVSLISTLRKKEFGEFLFIQKEDFISEVWIRLIKSNIYDIEFHFIDDLQPSRIKMLMPGGEKDIPLRFESSRFRSYKHPVFGENSIIKFSSQTDLKIRISFKDRYNNTYFQVLNSKEISNRKQINKLNLTFGGSQ